MLKNKWPTTELSVRYKLFAELAIELVDSESWESYRCHALSTRAKILETITYTDKIIDKTLPKPALQPIIEELNDALFRDPIVRLVLEKKGLKADLLSVSFLDPIETIENRVRLILELIMDDYKFECENYIKVLCKEMGSKKTLQTAIKLYISHLVNLGFSKLFILESGKHHFANSAIKRCSDGLLQKFFNNFDGETRHEYDVLLLGRSSLIEFYASTFGMQAYDKLHSLPYENTKGIPDDFGRSAKSKIIRFSQIKALDPYSAAKTLQNILSITRSIQYLNPSKIYGDFAKVLYVHHPKSASNTEINLGKLFQPQEHLKTLHDVDRMTSEITRYVFARPKEREINRTHDLYSSLRAVSLASNSTDHESRLITMWSAIEALLPEPPKNEGSNVRITHFVPAMVPCACQSYLWDLFNECRESCQKIGGDEFTRTLNPSDEIHPTESLMKIMLGPQETKDAVLNTISISPLLLNRIGKLHNMIHNPRLLLACWEQHETRVTWQIHRIYRERNNIVHKATANRFLEGLVENIFSY